MSVDAETAEVEFARLCAVRRLNIDVSSMSAADAEQFRGLKTLLCDAIEQGHLTVDAEGLPTVHLLVPFKAGEKEYTQFTFKRPRAGTLVLTGKMAKSEDVTERSLALIAQACGTSLVLDNLDMDDLQLMEAVFGLFFAKRRRS